MLSKYLPTDERRGWLLAATEIKGCFIVCPDCGVNCEIDQVDYGQSTSVPCVTCAGCGFLEPVDTIENMPEHWYDPLAAELEELRLTLATLDACAAVGCEEAALLADEVIELREYTRWASAISQTVAETVLSLTLPTDVDEAVRALANGEFVGLLTAEDSWGDGGGADDDSADDDSVVMIPSAQRDTLSAIDNGDTLLQAMRRQPR